MRADRVTLLPFSKVTESPDPENTSGAAVVGELAVGEGTGAVVELMADRWSERVEELDAGVWLEVEDAATPGAPGLRNAAGRIPWDVPPLSEPPHPENATPIARARDAVVTSVNGPRRRICRSAIGHWLCGALRAANSR